MTPLDRAWLAAEAESAGDDARLRFYALLLETPLCVPVSLDGAADAPKPLTFQLDDGPAVLAFDDDARLAAFFGKPSEYVTLTGRALAAALAEARLALGLNLGEEAPSATLLDADAVAWLAAEMGGGLDPSALEGPVRIDPPSGASPELLAALAARVAACPGMISEAWLVRIGPDGAAPGRLVVLFSPAPAAARAVEGLCATLAAAAAAHAPRGEAVDAAPAQRSHPLLDPIRRIGVPLHAPPEAPRAERPSRPQAPPRLR